MVNIKSGEKKSVEGRNKAIIAEAYTEVLKN